MSRHQPDAHPEPAQAPPWGVARILRLCTGVHEPTLSKVPSERPRYTAMGGVVAGTALMAMLSMSIAMYCVFGEFKPITLVIVPIWGLFILSLDRWLVSSTSMDQAGAVVRRLFPRLLLSMALGVVVAEPMLLGVYNTAIVERAGQDRVKALDERSSDLQICNPVPGSKEASEPAAKSVRCEKLRLQVDSTQSPQALQAELDDTTRQAADLRAKVEKDSAEFEALETKARDECNGTKTPDTTGRFGVGPSCRRLRELADQFYADRQIAQNSSQLQQFEQTEKGLTEKLGTARAEWVAERDRLIREDLDGMRGRQQEIGLLERFRTLDALVSENNYVHATQWALRIFFIIVDALPVLLKMLSGVTQYDLRMRQELALRERRERLREDTELHSAALDADNERHAAAHSFRNQRAIADHDARITNANLEQARGRLIDARTRHLVRAAGGRPLDPMDPDATQELYLTAEPAQKGGVPHYGLRSGADPEA